jgi:hypothetical protein
MFLGFNKTFLGLKLSTMLVAHICYDFQESHLGASLLHLSQPNFDFFADTSSFT